MKIFLGAGTTKIVAPLFLCVCLPFLFLALLDRTAEEWQETEWERMTCSTGGTGRTTTTTTTSLFIFLPFVWLHCIERLKSDREQDVREGMAARDARGPRAPETWASHYLLRIHFFPFTSATSRVLAPDNPVEHKVEYLEGIHLQIEMGNTITYVSLSMFLNLWNLKNYNKLRGRELVFGFYLCGSTEKNYVTSPLRGEIWDGVAEGVTVSRTPVFKPV